MKTTLHILVLLTVAVAAAPSVIAFTRPEDVPDGGATAAVLVVGVAGLIAAKRFLRKK